MKKTDVKKVTFSVPEPLVEKLIEVAAREGMTRSVVVTLALKEYFRKEERNSGK